MAKYAFIGLGVVALAVICTVVAVNVVFDLIENSSS